MKTIAKIFIIIAIGTTFFFNGKSALPNGINPPRPKNSPIQAIYITHNSSQENCLYRVFIRAGQDVDESLKFSIDGFNEMIPIKYIKKIAIISNEIVEDKYILAEVLLSDEEKPFKCKLLFREGDNIFKLSGYNIVGIRKSIDLNKLKEINFIRKPSEAINHDSSDDEEL